MATAWTVHGMRDEGSCVVRCVRGVRGVCVCVQASPAACSTYRAGQLAASPSYTTPVMDNMLRPTEKSCDRQHTHTCRPLGGELASPLWPSHVISCSLPSPTALLASM